MGAIRETLGKSKALSLCLGAALVIGGGIAIAFQGTSIVPGGAASSGGARFTTDDGRTLFEAPADSLPPFDHDGKPAARAHVYRCGGKEFVGYLERYTPEA